MSGARHSRHARAALVFAATAPVFYLAQRLFERARGGPGDPLGVVRELHTAFYWRASAAVWLAATVASLVALAPQGVARELRPGSPLGTALLLAVALVAWAAAYP